ncbi:MAG TPA: hypothetical protein VNH11_33820 [Pirellulales bacterium]|nr:hypothetical protein [Pirellulales bacterium]
MRQFGMRVCEIEAQPLGAAGQFGLKKLFTWMAGAALISLAWRYFLDQTHGVSWPRTFGTREILIEGASRSVSLTLIELAAVWTLLRCPRLHWRHAWTLAVIVLVQTPIWRQADWLVLGRNQSWLNDLLFVCVYDAFYLAPLVTVLLVARFAGYRLRGTTG